MPTSGEVPDGAASRFHCTAPGCTYSKRDACGIVLHMRTHFVYETAEEEMPKATFLFKDGIYQCLDCNRKTDSRLSFREHVRHHILPYPYRCHCGTTVASIPDLRRHSSTFHSKTPLQMFFEDAEQLLDDIFSEIGPLRRTFWFPQRITPHDSSAEVEILSDLHEATICGSVLNESNLTDVEITDNAASRISVNKASAEPRQKENCCVVPSANGSRLGKGSSSASASVLEFSAEYNYINAFSYSAAATESDSSDFCVLNVPDDGLDESRTDCLEDVVQGHVKKPEDLPIKWQWVPQSEGVSNLQGFDDSLSVPLIIDSRCTTRDNTPSNSSCSVLSKDNRQVQVESDSELLTVFSHVTGHDSEVCSPSSQDNRTESEPDTLSLDEPVPASGPGKFVFRDEKFKCLTCLSWETVSEQLFKKHVWQHFHGTSKICNRLDCQSTDCPLVLGMVMLVKSILPSMDMSEYPRSSTPTLKLSEVRKASNISSKRPTPDNLCDVEPSSPTAQEKNATPRTETKNTDKNLFENLTLKSTEQLRFSAPTLNSLRTKACRHLNFKSDLVGDFAGTGETFRKDDREIAVGTSGAEVACVTNTELTSKMSGSTENISPRVSGEDGISPRVSGEDGISPRRRKQMLSIRHDTNQPVEYCRYSRDSTPLSTVCDQCSYTCNCSVQLSWHVESCHPKLAVKKKKEYCCTECGFSDNSKDTLIWHMAHHIGEHTLKIFACRYCSRQSTYMSRVMKHIYHSHPGKALGVRRESTNIAYMDGIFKCPFCSSGYPWGSLFFRHIEVQHRLKKLADYLALAYRKKCCPEAIEFPKDMISDNMTCEISKDNQSSMDKNDSVGSATPCCKENENVSTILQQRENTTDSIESSHSKNCTETDDRANDYHVSEPDALQNSERKGTKDSRNAGFSSAKSLVYERWANVSKNTKRGAQKSNIETNSEKQRKKPGRPKGNTGHLAHRPDLGKSPQNDIIYNSTKRRIKKYQGPSSGKRSFLISPSSVPSSVPTLPRNVGNHTTSDFEKSLPNEFIFSQAIKCPKCYYTDRIRLNLIRHYNGHLTDASKAETSEASNTQANRGDGLTFALWNPKNQPKEVPESDKPVSNKRKNLAAKEKDKERVQRASQKGQSGKGKRTVKRARLTEEVSKPAASDGKAASHGMDETTNRGSGISIDDSVSGHSSTASSDIRTTSASLGSSPAFGQFLQNHARKIVSTHRCESCSTTFSSETDYEKHAKDVHSSTYYLCRCCGTMIRGLSNVQLHFKENHPGSAVLVDEWVSANKESKQRTRPFSEASDVGLPAKKMKTAKTDADKGQLPEKSDSEREDLLKGQKWSSFYGANLRKQPAGNTVQIPTVEATNDEFSTLNMTSEVSLSISSQMTSATTTSMTGDNENALGASDSKLMTSSQMTTAASVSYNSTVGDNRNALCAPGSNLMTSMPSHSIPSSSFPSPLAGNSLLTTFMTNLFAANMMTTQTVPVTQVPAMQTMGTQIPSSVGLSAPGMMAGSSLPVPGIQPVVDTSGFANLLARLLMANLAAGTGMTVPTSFANQGAANPGKTAYPFQPAANQLNLLGTSTNPQHAQQMHELLKEAINPSYGSNMYSVNAPGSGGVIVQNTTYVANISEGMPNISLASTLAPGASSLAIQDSCLDPTSKPVYAATSGSKTNRLSAYDNLCSSEAESTTSCVSQRSNISKSSVSTATSKKSSKKRIGKQKQKKSQFLRFDSEKDDSDIETSSSICSVSTTDLSTKEHCNYSSPLSVAESFADRTVRMCCNNCTYKTRKLGYFEKHLAEHLDNKQPTVDPKLWKPVRQKCGFCNFQTFLDEDFEEHVAMHMIKKPFQCWYCSFSGFTKVSVNRHLRKVHPELELKVKKNQNVRLKQTVLHNSVTKVSLNAVVKLKNVSNLNDKALTRLCNKYQLVKLNLKVK